VWVNKVKKIMIETIRQIKSIIKGNIGSVIAELTQIMIAKADKLEFEQAQVVKDKIDILENIRVNLLLLIHELTMLMYCRW